jgi:protein-S-isoprenylcysteine O-methyltransferase Ste14
MTKLLWALSVLVFLIMSVVSVFLEIEFRFTEWAIALGTVLASGAGAIRLKGIMDADKTLQKKEDE